MTRYNEMKEKTQISKALYQSRHYTQCAKFNEQLLSEVHNDVSARDDIHDSNLASRASDAYNASQPTITDGYQVHPLHVAYLNFYTALSHDTLAREATLKNRYRELSLAEKHYSAAIAVLSLSHSPKSEDEQLSSPVSTTFNEDQTWTRRSSNAGSFDSTTSAASSATSYSPEILDLIPELTPKRLARSQFSQPARSFGSDATAISKILKRNDSINAPALTQTRTPQGYQFAADTSAFVRMMEAHLASVKQLKQKTAIPGVRFTFPSPPISPATSKPRNSHLFDNATAEAVRQKRRTVTFRPRFDPSSVQRLCTEALAEIS
ncbi:hypothetical protein N0V83_004247 [Neocucurbitaria cava]|uniref:Uncharacterized protein n=1 Tax=Neocucurbitaria cava TaxID=798079 RepID=A0A9W9CNW6_9PLEO|nr:hypothetical protein N0V83_004247 [Neocucurbitaria cava]